MGAARRWPRGDGAPGAGVPLAANGDRYRGSRTLVLPKGRLYTLGKLTHSANVYQLTAVPMTGIVRGYPGGWVGTMTGTVTTDGTRGRLTPAQIVGYDIHVDGVQTTP